MNIIADPSKPDTWKKLVKKTVKIHWFESLISDCFSKSTLSHCNIDYFQISRAHPIWTSVSPSLYDIKRTVIKLKQLTGTYPLRAAKSQQCDPVCTLCDTGDHEDTHHFVTICSALSVVRKNYKPAILDIIKPHILKVNIKINPLDTWVTNIIIDPSILSKLHQNIVIQETLIRELKRITRACCFDLHSLREKLGSHSRETKTKTGNKQSTTPVVAPR